MVSSTPHKDKAPEYSSPSSHIRKSVRIEAKRQEAEAEAKRRKTQKNNQKPNEPKKRGRPTDAHTVEKIHDWIINRHGRQFQVSKRKVKDIKKYKNK
jgi:hypothetical protein